MKISIVANDPESKEVYGIALSAMRQYGIEQYTVTNDLTLDDFQEPNLYIISMRFVKKIDRDFFKKWLEHFFVNKKNTIIFYENTDSNLEIIETLYYKKYFDLLLPFKDNVYICYADDHDRVKFKEIESFNLIRIGHGSFWDINSVKYKITEQRQNKFLLTTIPRAGSPHRKLLVDGLEARGLLNYHIGRIANLGEKSMVRQMSENADTNKFAGKVNLDPSGFGMPGMSFNIPWDLYEQVGFEIAPETNYKDVTMITEKTVKSIVAKIPFVILGNCNHYDILKSLGFKTFDTLIDESFAYEPDLHVRTEKLLNTVEHIVEHGILDFYNSAKEICDYNFEQWLYVKSKSQHECINNIRNLIDDILK